MAEKKGAGGKQQPYDELGRYSQMSTSELRARQMRLLENNSGAKEWRQNTPYEEILQADKENFAFAGGILDEKRFDEDYEFTKSKFSSEEADVYVLKDGVSLVFQSMGDEYYQRITPQQAMRVWNKVPNYLKRFAQREIEFVDYYNPDDETVWKKVYSNFSHSFATSGEKITFYRNNESSTTDMAVFRALCHEIGHNFDRTLGETSNHSKEWEEIIKKDGGDRVSEYAKNHIREDFADSVAMYVIEPIEFERKFPNRFHFMEKWLKGGIL